MNKLFALTLSVFLLASVSYAQTDTVEGMQTQETATMDIVATASADTDLETLVQAVARWNLVEALQAQGPYTVFAPNNLAFASFDQELLARLLSDEGIQDLVGVLQLHVVVGAYTAADLSNGMELDTIDGRKLKVEITEDGSVMINNAKVIEADIQASNGIIHKISDVLTPAQPLVLYNDMQERPMMTGIVNRIKNRMNSEKRQSILERTAKNFSIDGIQENAKARLTAEARTERQTGGLLLKNRLQAINFLHNNGLTKFNDETSFMADNALRRDEAAAFYVRFARDVLGMQPDETKQECLAFTDINEGHTDLTDEMIAACQLDLFKGSNWQFMPRAQLTNAQALAVLIRLLDGFKSEDGNHWASNYLASAKKMGLTVGLQADSDANLDRQMTRGDIAKILEAAALIEWIKDQFGSDDIMVEQVDGEIVIETNTTATAE